ncbi:MAG: ABC transporter permease [Myxococcota bacterium]
MSNTITIAKKELSVYLATPMAWIVFTGMSFISSLAFLVALVDFKRVQDLARQYGWQALPPDMQTYRNLTDGVVVGLFGFVLIITLFATPFLSMRLIAEERRQKTFELLMTTPTRGIDIVLGKYLGALAAIVLTLSVTLVYPLILSLVGSSESGSAVEWSTVGLAYLALTLFGATCMAVGVFVSSLTDSQIVAGVITMAILLVWWFAPGLLIGLDEPIRSIALYLSFNNQVTNLMKGVLDLKPIVYFLSIIALFLLLTHRSVEARRWA